MRACLFALSLLVACTRPPTHAELAALALSGDDAGLLARLADAPADAPAQRWGELVRAAQALDPERAAVRRAERDLLADRVEEALDAGSFRGISGPLSAGLATYPDDPRFRALQQRLERVAAEAPADQAAAAWAALAASVEHDPDRQAAFLRRHRHAALRQSYAPGALAETRAAQAGIQPEAAHHLLRRIDAEYYVAPGWGAATDEAAQALDAFAAAPGARAAWPTLSDVTWPAPLTAPDIDATLGHLDQSIAAGAAAGLPAEVVVDVWTAAALAGLDPWTRAVWPAEMASWERHHAGVTVGVGVVIEATATGGVRVVHPVPGSPAWQAGVHQDDTLLTLEDDRYVAHLPDIDAHRRLEVAEMVLAGEPGTSVALSVARGDDTLDFALTRAPVPMETVLGFDRGPDNAWRPWLHAADGLAYVRIPRFREASQPDLDALLDPHLDGIRGLVIDLRGNPGGDVNAAVQIADRFLADGLLAELAGRVAPETGPDVDPETGKQLVPWNQAVPGHALEGTPVVVVVDADTASAAEILAGILQERAGAVVVGAPTWGKGLAQALRVEPELGYGVQFTNQVWALPSGRRLSRADAGGGGIQPDLLEALSPGERYQTTGMARQRGALKRHADGSPMRPPARDQRDDLPTLSADPALIRAELALRALLARPSPE